MCRCDCFVLKKPSQNRLCWFRSSLSNWFYGRDFSNCVLFFMQQNNDCLLLCQCLLLFLGLCARCGNSNASCMRYPSFVSIGAECMVVCCRCYSLDLCLSLSYSLSLLSFPLCLLLFCAFEFVWTAAAWMYDGDVTSVCVRERLLLWQTGSAFNLEDERFAVRFECARYWRKTRRRHRVMLNVNRYVHANERAREKERVVASMAMRKVYSCSPPSPCVCVLEWTEGYLAGVRARTRELQWWRHWCKPAASDRCIYCMLACFALFGPSVGNGQRCEGCGKHRYWSGVSHWSEADGSNCSATALAKWLDDCRRRDFFPFDYFAFVCLARLLACCCIVCYASAPRPTIEWR